MACLLKAPDADRKGCVTFTTPERDQIIFRSSDIRRQIERLKQRYVVGLHHNWHDHEFRYDSLFDFSMAGDGDLVEITGHAFPRIPLDACNFSPDCYSKPRLEPFWDILYVARAVNFKGIPQFFRAIRALYDRGLQPRVLLLCAVPKMVEIPGIPDLRLHFESLFSARERERVTFLTLDWDYPFPLDAESLAHFYRCSRIFFHAAPDERRCRTAAYAWAGGMPVVCSPNVASILPARFHKAPFLYLCSSEAEHVDQLEIALTAPLAADSLWEEVAAEFSAAPSAVRLEGWLQDHAAEYRWGAISRGAINSNRLDIRLGRHHGLSTGPNRIEMSITEWCQTLLAASDGDLLEALGTDDPEVSLAIRKGFAVLAPETATEPLRALQRLRIFPRFGRQ